MTCQDCKYWDRTTVFVDGWRKCKKLGAHSAGLVVIANWYGGITTAPDFACNQCETVMHAAKAAGLEGE